MNSVALLGTLTEDPELHEDAADPVRCRMRLAVPRHDRSGRREPGVAYVAVTTFGSRRAIAPSGYGAVTASA